MDTTQDDIELLARETRAKCRQMREHAVSKNIVEAILEFEGQKKTTGNIETTFAWLQQNLSTISQLEYELRKQTKAKDRAPLIIHSISLQGVMDCALSPSSKPFTSVMVELKCSSSPELDDVFDFIGITAFPGMFFKTINNEYVGNFDLLFYGKEYPVVAARNIFTLLSYEKDKTLLTSTKLHGHGVCDITHQRMDETISFRERTATLLQAHFPEVPSSAFFSMADGGLLPESIEEFTDWLLQYEGITAKHQGLQLPDNVSGLSHN